MDIIQASSIPPYIFESFKIVFIILFFASAIPVLSSIFKISIIPIFVFEIFVGIIIGPYGFGLIDGQEVLKILKILGLVFLIFLSGLDIDFDVIEKDKKYKRIAIFKTSFFIFIGIILTSGSLSFILYFLNLLNDWILSTIILSATFAGIVVPLVHKEKIHDTIIGQFIDTIATLSETFSLIAISIYMIVNNINEVDLVSLLILLMLVCSSLYIFKIFKMFRNSLRCEVYNEGMVHLGMRWTIVLLAGFLMFTNNTGGEFILGAFISGAVVKFLRPSHNFELELQSIGFGIFIPFFFVIVGSELNINLLLNIDFLLITFLNVVLLILSKMPILYLLKWYKPNIVIPTALLMSSTIIVSITAAEIGHALNIMTDEFGYSLIFASIFTSIISVTMFEIFFPFKSCNEVGVCRLYDD